MSSNTSFNTSENLFLAATYTILGKKEQAKKLLSENEFLSREHRSRIFNIITEWTNRELSNVAVQGLKERFMAVHPFRIVLETPMLLARVLRFIHPGKEMGKLAGISSHFNGFIKNGFIEEGLKEQLHSRSRITLKEVKAYQKRLGLKQNDIAGVKKHLAPPGIIELY